MFREYINLKPKILVVYYREDDPRKNTSMKMIRYGLAEKISPRNIRGKPLVLNPYSHEYLGPWHRHYLELYGVIIVDASWKKLGFIKFKNIRGYHVKLPPLLPGNPVNYGKPCILSSIEAIASTLYITGYKDLYRKLLGLYKWMNTFHTLNIELLEAYHKTRNTRELLNTIKEYWGETPPC